MQGSAQLFPVQVPPLKSGDWSGLGCREQPWAGECGAFGNCPEQERAPGRVIIGAFGRMVPEGPGPTIQCFFPGLTSWVKYVQSVSRRIFSMVSTNNF